MNIIVAVDKRWGIGYKGQLLKKDLEDLKLFRKMTLYNTVIMGRKTFESLPNKLSKRYHIVLTRNKQLEYDKEDDVLIANNLEQVISLKKTNSFVIGGAQIYRSLLPYCDTCYVTKFKETYTADTYFPNLDVHPQWNVGNIELYDNFEVWTYCKKKEGGYN